MDANPQAPFVDANPPVGVAQEGWQTVWVGSARLSVPQDWAVIDLRDEPTAYCTMFKGTPSLYLGPVPQPPPPCPKSLEDPVAGVHAVGFAELGGRFDGEPVEVNGHDGILADDDGQTSSYVFPDLALTLEVNYGPDPQLAEQVLSTLRPAEDSTLIEPSPAQPSARSTASEIDWEFVARDTDRGFCVGVHYSGAINGTGESCGVDAGLAEGQPFPRIDKSADIFHELGLSFVYGLVPPNTSTVILSFDDGSIATVETISVPLPEVNARAYVLELDRIARAQMGIALDSAGEEIVQTTFEVFTPPANP